MRTVVAVATPVGLGNTYAGEIKPRYESSLGFRVGGKILRREVNVGDSVRAGQVLARLDARDLALSQASSQASLAARRAQYEIALANFERDKKLLAFGGVSQLVYDNDEAAYKAAQAQLRADESMYQVSANQTAYAELRADHDGTITGIMAEAGQVVGAGETVARLAWSGDKEVATSIPEDQIARIRAGLPAQVSLWARPDASFAGTVREVSTNADPATRTYAVRVSVPQAPAAMQLGMTASVRIGDAEAAAQKLVHLPLPALVEHGGRQGVWVYLPQSGSVDFRPLQTAGVDGDQVLVAAGLEQGDIVVTAGAPLLLPGQKVKRLEAVAAAR